MKAKLKDNSYAGGNMQGGAMVKLVIEFALRLCQGGVLSLKERAKETKTHRDMAFAKSKEERIKKQ